MKKTLIQGIITIALFFSTWFILNQVDWMTFFNAHKVADRTEKKLGELFWDIYKKSEKENLNPFVVNTVDSIVSKICKKNGINKQQIKVHIFDNDETNAFALLDGHLLIYSGLVLASDNQEELSGVICHELAHIQLNHVMKKLIKEVGLSVLISMTTGQDGTQIIKETAKLLSSSAFDRGLEKEADIKAIEYLINAKINPEPFANFLYKLSQDEHEAMKYLSWARTHPDSKERAEYIITHTAKYYENRSSNYEQILSMNTWKTLKENLKK
ncbi:M48 family metallopeptidase [Prolixibacteraceae bacterium JC049]|nr:M48 family metallopeptidase [Prolixibacteraceae bacterium JC049]